MKKILATLLACGLALQTCAFASVEISGVEYDKATNKISTSATAGTTENTSVVITVGKKGETLSATNLPEFMYLYKTGASGAVDQDLALDDSIVSGKYTVYMNTAADGKAQKDVMVVNTNDNSEGGTIDVLASLNAAADAAALTEIINNKDVMDKMGVDPDEMSKRSAYGAYAAEILMNGKTSAWTVDTFIAAYNRALALSSAQSGDNLDAVMEVYASEFGTTYDDYKNLTSNEKAYAESYMTGIDFLNDDLKAEYENMLALMKYNAPDTWGELREVVEAERMAGNDAFDFRAYDEIPTSSQKDIYDELLIAIKDCYTEEEIAKAFWDITYAIYDNQIHGGNNDDYKPGDSVQGGGSWSNGGGGGPTTNIVVPSVPNPNDKDTLIGTGGSGYDTPTTESTPAPTETPVLEAGVFGDTANHWAKDYVKTLANAGVVGGYDDGTFLPNKNVTRAEYIKMIVGMFNLAESADNIFADVADGDWYAEYVKKALAAGLVEGDGGNFNPDATITRQDAAVILYRLGIAGGDTEIEFADKANVADYAKEAVDVLASAGIINGSDGNFNPTNAITRAETAAILCRAAEADMVTDEEPTEAPAEEVTEEPAEEVTEAPVEEVTEEPAEETTEEPTEDTTEDTSEDTTEDTTENVVEEDITEETTDEGTVTE